MGYCRDGQSCLVVSMELQLSKLDVQAVFYNSQEFSCRLVELIRGVDSYKRGIPSSLYCRKQYSVASEQNAPQGSGSTGKPPESGSSLPKIIVGTLTLGAVLVTAYHLNQRSIEGRRSILESLKVGTKDPVELSKSDKNVMSSIQESGGSPNMEPAGKDNVTHSDLPHPVDLGKHEESRFQVNDEPQLTPKEDVAPVQEKELPTVTSDDESKTLGASIESMLDMKSTEMKSTIEQHEAVENTPILPQGNTVVEENEMKSISIQQQTATDMPEAHGDCVEQPKSLLNECNLGDKVEETISTSFEKHKDLVAAIEDSNDAYLSKEGKRVVLQGFHAAEKRQAELDAQFFVEEKRKMKEINRERLKADAAAALKSLREELEDKHRIELEQKEAEAESRLKKVQELAKAELAAAIASEKASQIEKLAEVNLHINDLEMAFYARSEEARQSPSVHKFALGALALEDALSKGLPIEKEMHALNIYFEGFARNPLLDLVLSSLPKETLSEGTDTILQLKHKASFLPHLNYIAMFNILFCLSFDTLKGTLRRFSQIPPSGSSILARSLVQVESLLAEGKLIEAADTLEDGVKGTQAAEVINDWVRQVRNRAIVEQALTVIRSLSRN
ncbi:hypothetical protein RHGRI_038889 [Rhododendron griersonianum]|uniref:MICOS complex subunit MIC60 n=1 Tax=Rhododendron griersonianum TaxID=479676 RepID=A0AAV6HL05_9ERIC|nr:hypothetical protein RHGRI_038889 [Rhododendron griersonianum]